MPSTTYYWDEDDDNVCCEENENGEITASYTHEPGLHGELIAQQRDGQSYYHHYDGEGNTVAVTDENQNVVETATYSAFGEVVSKTSSITNPFGYKGALGYYTNGDTDDIYVRARTYEPSVGRWFAADPIGFPDGVNRYTYVLNNPILLVDPSGLLPFDQIAINQIKGSFPISSGDISGKYWLDADLTAILPSGSGFPPVGPMSSNPMYTGMWIVVDDSKRGQPCGNGGVRKWISAYTIYDQYLQVIGQPDKRDIPEGQGLMEPGEKYNQWNLDQWTNHTTNVDLPPIGAVPVPSGFWDMPGLLHVPGHPTGLPPGLMFVYKRYYAIAIICVCEPLKEMLTDPLSVLGYSLIDIRKTPVGGVQTAEVSVRVGNYGPSSWGNLKKPDGTRHGLTPVDSFTNNCC